MDNFAIFCIWLTGFIVITVLLVANNIWIIKGKNNRITRGIGMITVDEDIILFASSLWFLVLALFVITHVFNIHVTVIKKLYG
jgi:hypothetical protein